MHNVPVPNQNGPIYVSSNAVAPGLPNSASNNSVYGSQQPVMVNAPIPPPVTIYGQSNNGGNIGVNNGYGSQSQYGQPPIPSQQIPTGPGGPPTAPPPPPFIPGFTNGAPQPPVAPPAPMIGASGIPGAGPPPPPPPPMGLNSNGTMDMSSLAAQLQQTKTKLKVNAKANPPPPPPAENSGSSTSSGGSGNYGTIGRSSNGMASMMDEMAKTLARRRAQAEKKPEVCI